MLTIGLSGVQNYESYLRKKFVGRCEGDYRIRQGMDASAAIVSDGTVIACIAQERLDRQKQSSAFPGQAVRTLLDQFGFALQDVDCFAYAYNYGNVILARAGKIESDLFKKVLDPAIFASQLKVSLPEANGARVEYIDHHLAHAASVFFPSGLDDPLIVVSDAIGEISSTSIYIRDGKNITRIGQYSSFDSIGIFYSLVTMLLGFEFNGDEYKIMGLAPYGTPDAYTEKFAELLQILPDGQIRINCLRANRTLEEKAFFTASKELIRKVLEIDINTDVVPLAIMQDIAAALQKRTEEAILHIIAYYKQKTGKRTLAYAGGVAMNCCANRKLAEVAGFEQIFVGCASGDDGSALGAALQTHSRSTDNRHLIFPSPYLGLSETCEEIDRTLTDYVGMINVRQFGTFDSLCDEVVDMLLKKNVIAWHYGRSEFGARALGNRSILADPRYQEMQDKVNNIVKQRESFRPFAPIAMEEYAAQFFEILPNVDYRYMTVVTATKPEHIDSLRAVTHVDGSARLQIVSQQGNPQVHRLLERFHNATGVGVLMNTSFNVKGQPIVNTAREAVDTFLSTGLDGLVIEGRLLTKPVNEGCVI